MDHDADADPDVVLREAFRSKRVIALEPGRVVIELEYANVDAAVYFNVETAAEGCREIVLRFGEIAASAFHINKAVAFAAKPLIGYTGEDVSERLQCRAVSFIVLELNTAHELIVATFDPREPIVEQVLAMGREVELDPDTAADVARDGPVKAMHSGTRIEEIFVEIVETRIEVHVRITAEKFDLIRVLCSGENRRC